MRSKKILIGGVIILAIAGVVFFLFLKFVLPALVQDTSFITPDSTPVSQNSSDDFTDEVSPLTVKPTIDTGQTVANTIDTTGGDITMNTTATTATLTIPAAALAEKKEITLSSITALNGLPADISFVAGVQAEPNNVQFTKMANIEFTVAADMLTKGTLVGFEYTGTGDDFHYVPIKIDGQKITLPLTSFSGHGIILIPTYTPPLYVPSTKEAQAKQIISTILLANLKPNESLDDATNTKIINILKLWYTISVQPQLQAATTNDAMFNQSLHEYVSWISMIEFLGYSDNLASELTAAKKLLSQALNTAITQADTRCHKNKDVNETARLIWLSTIAEVFDLADPVPIYEKAFQCANFELVITSHLLDTEGPGADLQGTIPLNFNTENFSLEGSAELFETNPITSEFPCTSPPFTYTVAVQPTKFDVKESTESIISLPLSISVRDDITYDCSTDLVGIQDNGAMFWAEAFDTAHNDERTSYDMNHLYYTFNNWEVVNTDGVYARKEYKRTVDTVTENTTFELRHTPK